MILERLVVQIDGDDSGLERTVARSRGVVQGLASDAMSASRVQQSAWRGSSGAVVNAAGEIEGAFSIVNSKTAQVGESMLSTSLNMGRLNYAFSALGSQALGVSPVLGRLFTVLGGAVIGSTLITGAVLGVGALALAFEHGKAKADDYRKAIDASVSSADKLRQNRAFGGTFELRQTLANVQARSADIRSGPQFQPTEGLFGHASPFAQYIQAQGKLQTLVSEGITSGTEYNARQLQVSQMYAKLAPTLQRLVDLGIDESELRTQIAEVEEEYRQALVNLNAKLGVGAGGKGGAQGATGIGGLNQAITKDMVIASIKNPQLNIPVSDAQKKSVSLDADVVNAKLGVLVAQGKFFGEDKPPTFTTPGGIGDAIRSGGGRDLIGTVFGRDLTKQLPRRPGYNTGSATTWVAPERSQFNFPWMERFKDSVKSGLPDLKGLLDPKMLGSALASGGISLLTTAGSKLLGMIAPKILSGIGSFFKASPLNDLAKAIGGLFGPSKEVLAQQAMLQKAIEHNTAALGASNAFLARQVKGTGVKNVSGIASTGQNVLDLAAVGSVDPKTIMRTFIDQLFMQPGSPLFGSQNDPNSQFGINIPAAEGKAQAIIDQLMKSLGLDPNGFNSQQDELRAFVEQLSKAGYSLDDLAGSATKAVESLTNVPTGFRVAAFRYAATQSYAAAAGASVMAGAQASGGQSVRMFEGATLNLQLPSVKDGGSFVKELQKLYARGGAPVLKPAFQRTGGAFG